jgi:uncharacterized protein YeaO (DUF488 family)
MRLKSGTALVIALRAGVLGLLSITLKESLSKSMLKVKRIYDPPDKADGYRLLVDRLWPRGISKERARLDLWLKEIAPSDALRKWFGHDPRRWTAFVAKYKKELSARKDLLRQVKQLETDHGTVTLLYAAQDQNHNQAVALLRFLK